MAEFISKKSQSLNSKIRFCPSCHRRVNIPVALMNARIKGKIKMKCRRCKKGEIILEGTNYGK
jgi:hypothetical protein